MCNCYRYDDDGCIHINGSTPHHGLGGAYDMLLTLESPTGAYHVSWGPDQEGLSLYRDGMLSWSFVGHLDIRPEDKALKDWTQGLWTILPGDYVAIDAPTEGPMPLDDALCLLIAIHEARTIPSVLCALLVEETPSP